jgi:CBS domain-containing protein/anti-sigma regulatory factor (Ser/Thr protein kinase)
MEGGWAIEMPQITRLHELVYEIKIAEVMTREVVTVTSRTSMDELRRILREHRISGAPVVDNGQLVGVVSIEDLIKALAAGEMDVAVGKKMTRDPVALRADDRVVLAVDHFNRYGFGRFPVVDERGTLVGLLTQGDITRGLLKKLEFEYHEEEVRRYRASHIFEDVVSDRTSLSLYYDVVARDFDHAGEASSKIKRALNRLGFSPQIVRRAAIAAYEAEMNIIIHTNEGGALVIEVHPERIVMRAVDTGPGIPDIERAMEPGFSTAPEWVREMGFGAGMGLSNIKRCTDDMRLQSPMGVHTLLEAMIYLDQGRSRGENQGA